MSRGKDNFAQQKAGRRKWERQKEEEFNRETVTLAKGSNSEGSGKNHFFSC